MTTTYQLLVPDNNRLLGMILPRLPHALRFDRQWLSADNGPLSVVSTSLEADDLQSCIKALQVALGSAFFYSYRGEGMGSPPRICFQGFCPALFSEGVERYLGGEEI